MHIYFSDIIKFFKSSIWFFALTIFYRIILDTLFSAIIIPIYGSVYKYSDNSTTESIVISWAIFLCFAILTRSHYYAKEGVSNTILFLIFLMQIVPFTTMIRTGHFSTSYIIANMVYYLMLYLTIMFLRNIKITIGKTKTFVEHVSPTNKIKMLSVLLVSVALFVCARYSHFNINFSIDLVYDLRTAASLYDLPTILSYLFGWACWINPFIIGLCIREKKYIPCIILSIVQVFMYGYDGMKGPFFFFVVVVIINFFLPKIKMSTLNAGILYGLSGAVLVCYIIYSVSGNYLLCQLFVNRLGMITNQITYAFYSYFTSHQPDYFRGSFLRFFGIKSPYGNIPHMISQWFFGYDQGANGGLLADAITNMSYVGIIVMPIIIAFVLIRLDNYTEKIDRRLAICVSLYMTLMLMSMFILPIFLTGGLIVLFPLLKWINRIEGENDHEDNM